MSLYSTTVWPILPHNRYDIPRVTEVLQNSSGLDVRVRQLLCSMLHSLVSYGRSPNGSVLSLSNQECHSHGRLGSR